VASTIVEDAESLNAPAVQSTVYSFALLLLFSSFVLSIGAWLAKQPMKKYGIRV
jgi:phosphate transport system permease protein